MAEHPVLGFPTPGDAGLTPAPDLPADLPPGIHRNVQVARIQYVPPDTGGVYAAEEPEVVRSLPPPAPPPPVPVSVATTGDAARILRGTPLEPYGDLMEVTAARYGVDPRLLAVIAIKESSGGQHTCGFNAWGFGNCEGRYASMFASWEEAIEFVTGQLADASPYAGLETADKLCVWRSGRHCDAGDPGRSYAASAMALFP